MGHEFSLQQRILEQGEINMQVSLPSDEEFVALGEVRRSEEI
jgi:hypothetical protein